VRDREARRERQAADAVEPKPWEKVENGILYRPGYAVDLEEEELLFFVSPGVMRRLLKPTGFQPA
jgi:hypothetical protein